MRALLIACLLASSVLAGCLEPGPAAGTRVRIELWLENADDETYHAAVPIAANATGRPLLALYPVIPAGTALLRIAEFYASGAFDLTIAVTPEGQERPREPAQTFTVPTESAGETGWTRVAFRVEEGRVGAWEHGKCPLDLSPCGGPD